jgi:hypothetical protein
LGPVGLHTLPRPGSRRGAEVPRSDNWCCRCYDGGFVAFRSETSGPGNTELKRKSALCVAVFKAIAGEKSVIHRVLTDAERHVVFAYDLAINFRSGDEEVSPGCASGRRSVSPFVFERSAPLRAHEGFATFPKSTSPQTLDDGDAVSLELLVNRESGVKIYRRSERSPSIGPCCARNYPKSRRRTSRSMQFRWPMKGYELAIRRKRRSRQASRRSAARGSLLGSTFPIAGVSSSRWSRAKDTHSKNGLLDDNRIEFEFNDEFYEWISGRFDPSNGRHVEPLGVCTILITRRVLERGLLRREALKSPNMLEKLEDKLLTRKGITLLRQTLPAAEKNSDRCAARE